MFDELMQEFVEIEQAITDLENNKQDTLVSGENIKTINNTSILGSGNIDLNDTYYTEQEVDNKLDLKQDKSSMSEYYKKTETYSKEEVNTIKTTIEGEIPTKVSQLDNDSEFINKDVNNLTNYTKTSDMNTAISNAVGTETTNRQNADLNLQNQIDAITSASDVVDVVSTYQDLQEYDTSKLTEKDVVKVMQDSTHNNALAYYRWENNTWEYIGSEGPFYTKGETDELLNQKANQSTTYTKTETDNLLSNKVGFTDYASQAKVGVIKTASKFSTGMGSGENEGLLLSAVKSYSDYSSLSQYSFISKGTLENVITGKQLVNQTTLDNSQALQDNEINDLQSENDYLNSIINQLPKVSSQGTILTLNNTIKGRMNIELGTSELSQDTTTGKNLYDYTTSTFSNLNNIRITTSNNTITMTTTGETNSGNLFFMTKIPDNTLENGASYTISSVNVSGVVQSLKLQLRNHDGSYVTGQTRADTIVYDSNYSLFVDGNIYSSDNSETIPTGTTAIIKNVQVEKNSTATLYEPYTGGIASPNPSYPQDIHTISGSNTIKVFGKNLFDKNTNDILNAKYGAEVTADNNEKMCFIKCKPNTQYTLYHLTTSPMRNSIGTTQTIPAVGVTIEDGVYSATSPKTITTNANAKYIVWQFYATNDTQHTLQEVLDSMMIVEGDTLPPYESYNGTDYIINLGDIEYCEIGDYKDRFERDSSGNWGIRKNIGKVVLDGSETWSGGDAASGINTYRYLYTTVPQANNVLTDRIANYFTISNVYGGKTGYSTSLLGISVDDHDNLRVLIDESIIGYPTSASAGRTNWKSWLSTHNTIVYYALNTPTYTQITGTLAEQLETIYQYLLSQKEQTNISQVNNDLPFTISASALLDLNTLVGE